MPAKTITGLIIGDIVAKIGRAAVQTVLPKWQAEHQPDFILGNIENLAHGKGITLKTVLEVKGSGLMAATGGNHIWEKEDPSSEELQAALPLATPANDPRTPPQRRWQVLSFGEVHVFVLNLLGQFEMHEEGLENPFQYFEKLYSDMGEPKLLLVDFHAEATSEKVAFGHFVDGRASLVYGTHTHIPTADARILPNGTGYITDVGMTGSNDSVLGVDKQTIISRFLDSEKQPFDFPETGFAWVNALLCTFDVSSGRCLTLRVLREDLIIN